MDCSSSCEVGPSKRDCRRTTLLLVCGWCPISFDEINLLKEEQRTSGNGNDKVHDRTPLAPARHSSKHGIKTNGINFQEMRRRRQEGVRWKRAFIRFSLAPNEPIHNSFSLKAMAASERQVSHFQCSLSINHRNRMDDCRLPTIFPICHGGGGYYFRRASITAPLQILFRGNLLVKLALLPQTHPNNSHYWPNAILQNSRDFPLRILLLLVTQVGEK